MSYILEQVQESTKEEMLEYLLAHEDYALFLLGNYELYGYRETEAPNSGNYTFVRNAQGVVALYCLCRRGSLLLVADEVNEALFDTILSDLKSKKLTGLLGDWRICAPFWEYLKEKRFIQKETFASKEVLYSIALQERETPGRKGRLLTLEDFAQWNRLRKAYLTELQLPHDLTEEQELEQFHLRVEKKLMWGLFLEEKLVSMADLNAKAFDLCQLGGVYTDPTFRRRGLSKALIQQVMHDCKEIHGSRKMIIFTGEENTAARGMYESMDVKEIGSFAMLFGQT